MMRSLICYRKRKSDEDELALVLEEKVMMRSLVMQEEKKIS